ncbi:MAG: glycosyl hydrolase [Marinoscillum sp.]
MRKLFILILVPFLSCQETVQETRSQGFTHPEKPWVFWYWRQAAATKEGITADLEAMKYAGLGGAYLMPISGPTDPPHMEPVADQLSPYWWQMVKHSVAEAKRLDLELGFHTSDGFALAGGPWITPELSMQKVVWSETNVSGGQVFNDTLAQPEAFEGYYEELGIYAFPNKVLAKSSFKHKPTVSTSNENGADFLIERGNTDQFRCEEDCWFQYSFNEPFTAQSIQVITKGNNYQSHRLKVEASEDGENFKSVYQMVPPRHGWQDTDAQVTYSIPKTTARHFRFQWTKEGSEPGAEDLDAAKWSPILKIAGLELSCAPKIHQYEGKTGEVWRISPRTTETQLNPASIINQNQIIDLTNRIDENGVLYWDVPKGDWTILRMGHTSTGHTNYTGGGALGLECDKFNPEAINTQFDGWYGRILDSLGSDLTKEVVKAFHIDSWECGSQNWSPVFRDEFTKRQGYDPLPYLPIMAGVPVNGIEFSEKFLYDIRETIANMMIDNFYGIMAKRAHEHGMEFSAESVAPTMLSDGMEHYGKVDIPMGEFWLRSPTHDKPNDMMDAISGAHVYGKNIIQAEGFTELRMAWDEHPGMLKTLLDRNYALGINRLFFHVYMHNPWMDRQPGMTLDGVGLYFQRNQTWWKPGRAFVEYTERCQKLLQEGAPVVDVAVFTGEGLPRRSILPDRLVETLPGLFGAEVVNSESARLANADQPLRILPKGVKHSQNMADPEDWVDPLNGYKYDSFNKDALLNLASVTDGEIELSTGASYQLLVLPQARKMAPNPEYMSVATLKKLISLVENGATLLISEKPTHTPGLDSIDEPIEKLANTIWDGDFVKTGRQESKKLGKGTVIKTPYLDSDLAPLGLEPDLLVTTNGTKAGDIAWTHRRSDNKDIYFISNQLNEQREVAISLRVRGKLPVIYNPVTNQSRQSRSWKINGERTIVYETLDENESIFVILKEETDLLGQEEQNFHQMSSQPIDGVWKVSFDPAFGGPADLIEMSEFNSWTEFDDPAIKYYSGTATYRTAFVATAENGNAMLEISGLHDIAEVTVNGKSCGVIWTAPYEIDISEALKEGENQLTIEVTNTWRNRMIRDHDLPESERLTWTTAPYRLDGEPLLPAGITGSVSLKIWD